MVLYLSDVHTNKIDNNRLMEKKERKSNSPEEEFLGVFRRFISVGGQIRYRWLQRAQPVKYACRGRILRLQPRLRNWTLKISVA